eukprot:NODE_1122_length_602_cov_283.584087_g1048_i0.p1 GENE.NODE_1122_length_602_cov_283.584087_g1048_i0~~NODE_1122_length_602_cov_283.584087_g1048_i0.p1  ORF type:complete len:138 (-),score=48.86 NODE_1122_length_602_cov_283.584087_g1048_i0:188-580(-)
MGRLDRNRQDCVDFYDFFMFDNNVRDYERCANPKMTTFGYCSRAWLTALYIFAGLLIIAALVMLMLAIFSFTKKLWVKTGDDVVQVEVRPVDVPYGTMGAMAGMGGMGMGGMGGMGSHMSHMADVADILT